jgi:predicted RND superfamily exporter protein
MAISAPLAMLVIFLLMLYFFRKIVLILSPMIVAIVSVIMTMGLLVVTGNTIHIMSSMIPIFIMPIAVLDAIHILSDFFDRYQETRDRKITILHVMRALGSPMLFTSLTTMAGFASLALTPIPPVQVFGLFVAFGVAMAWIWTVTFIPAYVMFIGQESLENFGFKKKAEGAKTGTILSRLLDRMGPYTHRHAKGVMAVTLILVAISVYGISRIRINDNPIKWFHKKHPIRVADKVLNEHFGGTYMGYLAFEPEAEEMTPEAYLSGLNERLEAKAESLAAGMPEAVAVFAQLKSEAAQLVKEATSEKVFLAVLQTYADDRAWNAPDEQLDAWDEAIVFLDLESMRDQVFKQPEVLNYVASLQDFLLTTGVVGKSNSLPDIVKTVYRELMGGEREYFQIPDSPSGVAQVLLTIRAVIARTTCGILSLPIIRP